MKFIVDIENAVIAENLRRHRDRAFPGWGGIGRFAKAVGVSHAALSRWLSGEQMPSMARLSAVAEALGVEAWDLCRRNDPEAEDAGAVPENIQGQIAAIDALTLLLAYTRRTLLGEMDAKRHREGVRIIGELLKSEME